MTDSFWTKVLWSRFIKHFRKLTDEQIIKDIHESMDALEDNDASGDSFGAKMVAWANERRNEKAAVASRENGNLGGRPKKNTEGAANGNNADCDTSHECAHPDSTTAFESLGSGKPKTQAQNDQRRAGGHLLPSSSLNRSPARSVAVDVLNLAYAGEFGNVRLTQEQYAQLGIKFGNQQKLNRAIDSLSCQIENGEKNPQNHYAELVKWASYRDDMEEKEELRASSAPHYETVSEHNARIVRESDKWIDEYYAQKRKAANGK